MSAPEPWTFRQIGGPQKELTLTGYNAPFGRPRKGAVVTDGYGLRHSETYYNGFGPPTRHIFGDVHDGWELHGRWMDSVLGPRGARDQALYVKQFIADAQLCRIAWGSIVVYTGILLHIKLERESDAQIAWTLTVGIDSDDLCAQASAPTWTNVSPIDNLGAFLAVQSHFQNPLDDAPDDLALPGGLLDAIDAIVSSIATFTGSLVAIAEGISDFEQASSAELNRLRGVIGQVSTAYQTLAGTLDDARCDFAVGEGSANSQTTWMLLVGTDEQTISELLTILGAFDRQAEIALRIDLAETVGAQSGDTWESLSIRSYGGVDRADDLRQANMARYGAKPTVGRPIVIPRR